MQHTYGVATISRLFKIIGLFRKRALWKRPYSAKETYNLKEPTNRSHPICVREYRLFYRSLLQKKPIILRSLLIVATPYDSRNHATLWLNESCNTHTLHKQACVQCSGYPLSTAVPFSTSPLLRALSIRYVSVWVCVCHDWSVLCIPSFKGSLHSV